MEKCKLGFLFCLGCQSKTPFWFCLKEVLHRSSLTQLLSIFVFETVQSWLWRLLVAVKLRFAEDSGWRFDFSSIRRVWL